MFMFLFVSLQVKIWFQNKRSKFKKLLKQSPGGNVLTPQPPGSTSINGLSPSAHSDDEQDTSAGHGSTPGPQGHPGSVQGHTNGRLNNGQPETPNFDSPSPQQSGHLMSPPPVSASSMLPPGSGLGGSLSNPLSHSSMSSLPPPMSHMGPPGLPSWADLNGDHGHGSPVPSHMASAMYGGQYLPPSLPQHYGGWSYGAPQNSMIT